MYQFIFFKTTTDIALKLTTLFHPHYLHQQTRVHNTVEVFEWIIALFLLRILVNFFVPIYLFSKPLQIWLRNLRHFFTIITSSNRHEYITLSRFLYELLPFFHLEFWCRFSYHLLFFKTITDIALKLTILIDFHYFYQQTRVHNSVKMLIFLLELWPFFALDFWLSFSYHPNFV